MLRIFLFVMSCTFLLASCSPSESTTESAQAIGSSGNFSLIGVECYGTDNQLTDVGTLDSMFVDVAINGDDYTEMMSDPDCAQTTTGKIVFNSADGTYKLSDIKITRNWECRLNGSVNLLPTDIAPNEEQNISFPAVEDSSGGMRMGRYISHPSFGDAGWTVPLHFKSPEGSTCYSVFNRVSEFRGIVPQ